MGLHGIQQEFENRPTLLGASGSHRPDAFAQSAAFLAPRPLSNPPVDDHKANRLFGQIVGRLDPRRGHEAEVCRAMLAKALGQVAGVFRVRHAGRARPEHLFPCRFQRLPKPRCRQLLAAVDHRALPAAVKDLWWRSRRNDEEATPSSHWRMSGELASIIDPLLQEQCRANRLSSIANSLLFTRTSPSV
jgi:hypothetical protein